MKYLRKFNESEYNGTIILTIDDSEHSKWYFPGDAIEFGLINDFFDLKNVDVIKLDWDYLDVYYPQKYFTWKPDDIEDVVNHMIYSFEHDKKMMNVIFNLMISRGLIDKKPTIDIEGIDEYDIKCSYHFAPFQSEEEDRKEIENMIKFHETKKYNL